MQGGPTGPPSPMLSTALHALSAPQTVELGQVWDSDAVLRTRVLDSWKVTQ